MTLRSFALFAVYFASGVALDFIITVYYRAISSRRAWLASLLAFVITAATMLLIEAIVVSHNTVLILAYAAGTALGTRLGMGVKQ